MEKNAKIAIVSVALLAIVVSFLVIFYLPSQDSGIERVEKVVVNDNSKETTVVDMSGLVITNSNESQHVDEVGTNGTGTSPQFVANRGYTTETLGVQGVVGRIYGSGIKKQTFGEQKLIVHRAVDTSYTSPDIAVAFPGGRFLKRDIPILASASSSPDGYFSIFLEPGEYSLFVVRGKREFCATHECNFSIITGSTTRIDAVIDRSDE